MTLRRLCLLPLLLLAACAGPRWSYTPLPGISEAQMRADLGACRDESRIERLREEQIVLEQQCMMDHGYRLNLED